MDHRICSLQFAAVLMLTGSDTEFLTLCLVFVCFSSAFSVTLPSRIVVKTA